MAQSVSWTKAEDVLLCEAWLAATKHPIHGSCTLSLGFWTDVKHRLRETLDPQKLNAIKSRFLRIALAVKDFTDCSSCAQRHRKRTDTDDDVRKTARGIYIDRNRTLYTFTHCWKVLKSHPKFIRTEAIPANRRDPIEKDREAAQQAERRTDSTGGDTTTEAPVTTHDAEIACAVVAAAAGNRDQTISQQDQEQGTTEANPASIATDQGTDQAHEQHQRVSTVPMSVDADQAAAQQAQETRALDAEIEQSSEDPASVLGVFNARNRVDQGTASAVTEEALPAQIVPASTPQDPAPRVVDMDVSAAAQVSAVEALLRMVDDGRLGENMSSQQAPRKRRVPSEDQSSGKKPRQPSSPQPPQGNVFEDWSGMEASRAAIQKQQLLLEMNLRRVQVLQVTLEAVHAQAKAKENRIKSAKAKALARKGLRDGGMPEGEINRMFPL